MTARHAAPHRKLAMVALVKVFIRASDAASATFTRHKYPTSLRRVTHP
ncbi:hypothetical protein [Mycobacterium decipiens]|nr:hypothetical protein [Mycobacterium decipiens]